MRAPRRLAERLLGPGGALGLDALANARFRRLWAGQSVSALGDQVFLIALVLHVYAIRASAAAVATLLVVGMFAPAFFAPVGAALAERLGRRRLLVAADLVRAVLVVALLLTSRLELVLALYFLLGLASACFRPVYRSTVPLVVQRDLLRQANAASNLTWTISILVGPAVGAALSAGLGFQAAFLANAASFVVSAAFLWSVPLRDEVARPGSQRPKVRAQMRDAVRAVTGSRAALGVVATAVALVLFAPMVNGVAVFMARSVLGAGDVGFGLLVSLSGVGLVAGSLLLLSARRLPRSPSDEALYLLTFVIQGASYVLIGLSPGIAWAVAFSAIGGVGNGMDVALTDTLVQKHVPAESQTWVFAMMLPLQRVAGGASVLAGGVIAELLSPRAAYVVAGAGLLAAAVFGAYALPGWTRPAPQPAETTT
jgi:MFS family permease